jgi:hypothetical protein
MIIMGCRRIEAPLASCWPRSSASACNRRSAASSQHPTDAVPLARLFGLGPLGSFLPEEASNVGVASKLWRVMPTYGVMHRRSAVCG